MVERLDQGRVHARLSDGRRVAQPRMKSKSARDEVFVANIAEKRYLWTARAFAVVSALSLCCNVILILAIFQVVPLYRVEPFLLTFHGVNDKMKKKPRGAYYENFISGRFDYRLRPRTRVHVQSGTWVCRLYQRGIGAEISECP